MGTARPSLLALLLHLQPPGRGPRAVGSRFAFTALLVPHLILLSSACVKESQKANRAQRFAAFQAETLAQLEDPDDKVRRGAVRMLKHLPIPNKVELLAKALSDNSSEVRRAAVNALGETRDPRAVEPLIAALRDEEVLVRADAVEELAALKDLRAREGLIGALADSQYIVSQAAERALRAIGVPDAEAAIEKAAAERARRDKLITQARERREREEERGPFAGVCRCSNATTGVVIWERKVKSREECEQLCPDDSSVRLPDGRSIRIR